MKTTMLCALLLCSLTCCIHARLDEWTITEKPSPGHEVKLTFAIKQHNPDWLKDKLKAVSYPDSPHYTDYMNFGEIAQYVYGEPESVKVVTEALESMGANEIDFTIGRDFVVAWVPVKAAEEYFNANFYKFVNRGCDGMMVVASPTYNIPMSMKKHIDFLSGFELPGKKCEKVKLRSSPQNSKIHVTPAYIDKQYNISGYTSTSPQNSQAVAAFIGQYFDPSDLQMFQKKFNLPSKPITKIVGRNTPSQPGSEATSDIEYISATGRNVDTWFISVDSSGLFLSWIVAQVNTTNSPWVHSVSYGSEERKTESDYLTRVDNEFMKFGISGRTVLFASGDGGAQCLNGIFNPEWPGSSPHVTSVGGTISMDTVWAEGGGGFSNVFSMPDWQKEVVDAYLKSGQTPSQSLFNASGRAYPDISAFATNYEYILNGKDLSVDGTSLSTPAVAGIISILNDIRLNNGQKTLGFLNPLLYSLKGNGFYDVTKGANGDGGQCGGFKAIKGWDPASGWGSPNFGLLKSLI